MSALVLAWLRRFWPWPVALAVLLPTLALQLRLQPQWRAEAASLDDGARHDTREAVRLRARERTLPAPPRWHDALPDADARVARLAGLLTLARRHGLDLPALAQQPGAAAPVGTAEAAGGPATGDGPSALVAVRVDVQARGRYAELRAFLRELLQDDPALAIERLHLSRDDEAAQRPGGVAAELRLVLYEHRDGEAASSPPAEATR